jgi:2-isopropylmalate synthase
VHGEALGVRTRVDSSKIWALSRLVEERSGIAVPPNKAVVGGNAFRHASGIHQDGVLKRRETYEVLDPASIGHPRGTEIVLGKLSGRGGFADRVAALGFELGEAEMERAFRRFQGVAAEVPSVDDAALRAIVGESSRRRCPDPGFPVDG